MMMIMMRRSRAKRGVVIDDESRGSGARRGQTGKSLTSNRGNVD
jgi:hypothetical protein